VTKTKQYRHNSDIITTRGSQFSAGCGIWPLPQNFNISVEFHGIREMTGD